MPKFFKTAQAAEMIGLTAETLREKLRTGEIIGVRVGSQWRIPEEALLRYLQGNPTEAE